MRYLILVAALLLAHPLDAAADDGVMFPSRFEREGNVLTFQGSGPKSYLFIRVFVAGFYLGEGASQDNVLDDVAKRLEVHYSYRVPARQLARETRRRIRLNLSTSDFEAVRSRVDVMERYFVDLKPGDEYALTYLPGIGTQFTYNGTWLGTIEGADFARGLFSVWFGRRPLDETLRLRLLGKK